MRVTSFAAAAPASEAPRGRATSSPRFLAASRWCRGALKRRRLLRSKVLWGVLALLLAGAAYLLQPRSVAEDVMIEERTCLQVYDRRGRRLWRREMGAPVVLARMMTARDGEPRVVAAMLAQGPDAGCLFIFDGSGEPIARFDPGQTAPYDPSRLFDQQDP